MVTATGTIFLLLPYIDSVEDFSPCLPLRYVDVHHQDPKFLPQDVVSEKSIGYTPEN